MSLFGDPIITLSAAVALATIFALAAVAKLRDLSGFAAVVQNFRILPEFLARPFAYVLPPIELTVAVGLLVEASRGWAAAGALGLLAAFTAAIAINMGRGRHKIDCGCFGTSHKQTLSGWLIGRNAALALLAALCLSGPAGTRPMHWLDLVSGVGGGATLAFLTFAVDQLLAGARAALEARQRSA
jgi:hypothetical protein